MTGFARAEGAAGEGRWVWEAKSVNGRNLDIRCRVPAGFDLLEPLARVAVAERCRRGNVTVSLTLTGGSSAAGLRINRAALDQLLGLADELGARPNLAPARLDGLLAIRGVVEPIEAVESEQAQAARLDGMKSVLDATLDQLVLMRQREGARLLVLIVGHLDEIDRLAAAAGLTAAAQPAALKARLGEQAKALLEGLPALSEERLAQEIALLAGKADVREELDRLGAHIGEARALLDAGGAIGRKLDFLCQELNREANTLCSKSADMKLTNLGLQLKAAVEQLREQVQNVE